MNKKETKRFFIELFSIFFSFTILVFFTTILYCKPIKPKLNSNKVLTSPKTSDFVDISVSNSPKGCIGPEETISSHEDKEDFPEADIIQPSIKGSNANYFPPESFTDRNTQPPKDLQQTVIFPPQGKKNSSISIQKNTDAPLLKQEDTSSPYSTEGPVLDNKATGSPIVEKQYSLSSTTNERKAIGGKMDNLPHNQEVITTPYLKGDPLFEQREIIPNIATSPSSFSSTTKENKAIKTNKHALPSTREDIVTPYSTGDPLFESREFIPKITASPPSFSSTTKNGDASKTNTNALPPTREDIVTPYSTGDPLFEPREIIPKITASLPSFSSTTEKGDASKTNTTALPSTREDTVTPYSTGDPSFEVKSATPKTAEKKYSLSSTIKENKAQALPIFKVQSPISTIMVETPALSKNLGGNTQNTPKKSLQQSKKPSVSKKKRNKATKSKQCKPSFDQKLCQQKVSRACDRFISAGFIYWSVCQEGLAFAVPGIGFEAEKECIADIDSGWQPGFTLGLGLDLGCCWCIDIDYTWLQSCNGNKITADPFYVVIDDCDCDGKPTILAETSLIGYWDINNKSHPNLVLAEACLDVYFNDLQITTGRCISINRCIKAKLFFGLQGAWIYQDYHLKYRNTLNEQANTWMSQDFLGLGPMMGFEFLWNICGKINLYADVDVATLWSNYSVNRRDKEISAEHPNQVLIHTCQKINCIDPVLGMGVGFRYCNCYFTLDVGWQAQIWFDHNQYIKFSPGHTGDLILQGLKVEASIMF